MPIYYTLEGKKMIHRNIRCLIYFCIKFSANYILNSALNFKRKMHLNLTGTGNNFQNQKTQSVHIKVVLNIS